MKKITNEIDRIIKKAKINKSAGSDKFIIKVPKSATPAIMLKAYKTKETAFENLTGESLPEIYFQGGKEVPNNVGYREWEVYVSDSKGASGWIGARILVQTLVAKLRSAIEFEGFFYGI